MNCKNTPRKKRTDRTHIIYELVVNGKSYVGITAKTESTVTKSVLSRFAKHTYRARTEDKVWPLYTAMRKFGAEAFEVFVLETGRGKAWAHQRERELIAEMQPVLNLA
jgi:hypothetical protein